MIPITFSSVPERASLDMPRSPRYSFPGAIQHVILRGNQGRRIFYSDADRVRFCLLIQEGIERFGHRIHAFCLMSNHVHLAWQEGEGNLSASVQNLAFRYAQRVNRRRKEIGHVFQGRFRSILVNKAGYLLNLVRYIHLNPVRAGIVKLPNHYKWSGHNSYLGIDPCAWVEQNYVLSRFSSDRSQCINAYNEFVCAGIGVEPDMDFDTGFQSGIIGDDTFIQKIRKAKNCMPDIPELTASELIERVCGWYKISLSEIISSSRRRDLAYVRGVVGFFAREMESVSMADVANILNRDPSGLSRLVDKLDIRCRQSDALAEELRSLRKRLEILL